MTLNQKCSGNKKGAGGEKLMCFNSSLAPDPQIFMKTKSYRLNITPRHAKGWEIFAEVRKVVPPKVKIEDGGISINGQNATPGKYQLEVKNRGHKAIIINVEVIPEEKD